VKQIAVSASARDDDRHKTPAHQHLYMVERTPITTVPKEAAPVQEQTPE
jgi:hypothetical protein